jgi:cytochrome P450
MRMLGDLTIDREQLIELAHRQAELEHFVQGLIDHRRRNLRPEGDLISDLIAAQNDDGGPQLDDNEIFSIVALSIVGGGDTTVNLLSQLVYRLLDNDRRLWHELAADPDRIGGFIEEQQRI